MSEAKPPFCCEGDLARLGYDGLNAEADLERWRAGRLNPVTRELIDEISAALDAAARTLRDLDARK